MAKPDTLQDHIPPKPQGKPGSIQLVKFQGHEAASSMSPTTVFRVELFGIDSKLKVVSGQFGLNEIKAMALAAEYASLTGWKVRRFTQTTEVVLIVVEDALPMEAPNAK